MSFSQDRTGELWQSFMPVVRKIKNRVGSDLYSVEVYDPTFFDSFSTSKEFEKWAAVEVEDYAAVPEEMETLTLRSGLYAVFLYKGPASMGFEAYKYIFGTWVPQSGFSLDDRAHFALMGERYRGEDPDSEEEIWIPVKPKTVSDTRA